MSIVECPDCGAELKECNATVEAVLAHDGSSYTLQSWGDVVKYECLECGCMIDG